MKKAGKTETARESISIGQGVKGRERERSKMIRFARALAFSARFVLRLENATKF